MPWKKSSTSTSTSSAPPTRKKNLKRVFLSHRLESKLITAAERFTYGLNLVLVVALAGVSISVVALFVWDIARIFQGNIEKGILSALGSLLILWMMIELMDNEIKSLKGGRFNILVFIGVIIVALIREILISTLRHDALETPGLSRRNTAHPRGGLLSRCQKPADSDCLAGIIFQIPISRVKEKVRVNSLHYPSDFECITVMEYGELTLLFLSIFS